MQSDRPAPRRSRPSDRAGRRPDGRRSDSNGRSDDRQADRGGRPGARGESPQGRSRGGDDGRPRRAPTDGRGGHRSDGDRDGANRDGRGRDGRGRDDGNRGGGNRASGNRAGGNRGGRPGDGPRSRNDDRRAGGGRRDSAGGGRGGRDDARRRDDYDEAPLTEAQRRAIEVRRRRGPRPERDEDHERAKIEARSVEQWIDEGSDDSSPTLRPTRRSNGSSGAVRPRRDSGDIAPSVIAAITDAAGPARAPVLIERLGRAAGALDRERFGDAKRMITPLLKEIPSVAAVQEVAGLIAYGQARWRDAGRHLSIAREIDEDIALLPVLADVYRALGQWDAVERIWGDIRHASPDQAVMAEGRIVAASALADRGKVHAGIRMLESAAKPPKRIRDHHLRQWYVLGDLYDRAGDQLAATGWFRLVEGQDRSFADVADRLRQLGR